MASKFPEDNLHPPPPPPPITISTKTGVNTKKTTPPAPKQAPPSITTKGNEKGPKTIKDTKKKTPGKLYLDELKLQQAKITKSPFPSPDPISPTNLIDSKVYQGGLIPPTLFENLELTSLSAEENSLNEEKDLQDIKIEEELADAFKLINTTKNKNKNKNKNIKEDESRYEVDDSFDSRFSIDNDSDNFTIKPPEDIVNPNVELESSSEFRISPSDQVTLTGTSSSVTYEIEDCYQKTSEPLHLAMGLLSKLEKEGIIRSYNIEGNLIKIQKTTGTPNTPPSIWDGTDAEREHTNKWCPFPIGYRGMESGHPLNQPRHPVFPPIPGIDPNMMRSQAFFNPGSLTTVIRPEPHKPNTKNTHTEEKNTKKTKNSDKNPQKGKKNAKVPYSTLIPMISQEKVDHFKSIDPNIENTSTHKVFKFEGFAGNLIKFKTKDHCSDCLSSTRDNRTTWYEHMKRDHGKNIFKRVIAPK